MNRITSMSVFAAAAAVLVGAPASAQDDFSEVEIRAVEIKPGIAVLFGQGGNIGVSYGEDGTLLIDDQFAELSEKIQAAVANLGATPTKFLVNTHWHYDHTDGNENFGKAGAVLVAHDSVRERLIKGATVRDVEMLPAPHEALPVVTFDNGLTLHLNGDAIDLIYHGGGHTDGDAAVYWRTANVLHTGDMFMHQLGWPYIDIASGGNVEHLLNTLGRLIALTNDETIVIPGHGQIATQPDLIAYRDMIASAVEKIRQARASGDTLEETIAANPIAGMRNAPGFITDEEFIEGAWKSLAAHAH